MSLLFFTVLLAAMPQTNSFDIPVERVHSFRKQPGDLHIDEKGVAFRSKDGKTSITVPMRDLREASVADPHALSFQTYEIRKAMPFHRRGYVFRAEADAPIEDLARFLAAHIQRPVVGHYPQGSTLEIPAYHKHAFGGTNGTLAIGDNGLQFRSEKPADSRTWRYSEIETIGQPDRFSFRVSTNRETYLLELKGELPESLYWSVWSKVYRIN